MILEARNVGYTEDPSREIDNQEILARLMARLKASEVRFLSLRFGLGPNFALSREEVARALGISWHRACSTEHFVLAKLRKFAELLGTKVDWTPP